jgi:hypothetical protein
MTNAPDLRVVSEDEGAPPAEAPKVFVRVIPTPPGMPWDQTRAAALEARQGAPLPLIEVAYQVRRLAPWAPGEPGRHAAFYVRAQEVGEALETIQNVDGRSVTVRFVSFAEQRRQGRRLVRVAVGAAIGAALVLGVVILVGGARDRASDRLDATEQLASVKLHQASSLEKLKRQARVLDAAHVRGHGLDDFLRDLSWAASAKAAQARIEGLHWQDGYTAVEVRGEDSPFERLDRTVEKSPKPARPGVWLWGVTPAPQSTGGAQ